MSHVWKKYYDVRISHFRMKLTIEHKSVKQQNKVIDEEWIDTHLNCSDGNLDPMCAKFAKTITTNVEA